MYISYNQLLVVMTALIYFFLNMIFIFVKKKRTLHENGAIIAWSEVTYISTTPSMQSQIWYTEKKGVLYSKKGNLEHTKKEKNSSKEAILILFTSIPGSLASRL